MEDYPSNSYRSRAKETEGKKKELKKVISGEVQIKQKGIFQKVLDAFIPEDITDVRNYIVYDLLIPSAKEFVSSTVDAFLYRNSSEGRTHTHSGVRTYDYNGVSSKNRNRRNTNVESTKQGGQWNLIARVRTRKDAELLLAEMDNILDQYHIVTVSDFNELAGLRDRPYTDNNYGWVSITAAQIIPVRNGYEIRMPKPMLID